MRLRGLRLATQFLTRLPVPAVEDFSAEEFSRSSAWFPFVGLAIGVVVSLILLVCSHRSAALAAAIGLLAWVWMTGALHLDGLADLSDALAAAHRDPQKFFAVLADPQTGLLVGQTQTFPNGVYYDEYRIGGTSLASPIFAGLMALADQKAGHVHGFANPLLYDNPSAFYEVVSVKTAVARRNFVNNVDPSAGTVDRLRTFDDYSSSPTQHTSAGWDNVTGLGSPGPAFLRVIGQ